MNQQRCTKCNRELKENQIVWLTLDSETGKYHIDKVPEDKSQGAFPFGKDCAANVATIYRSPALVAQWDKDDELHNPKHDWIFKDDGECTCGVNKHHYHCAVDGKITQVG